MSTIRENRFQSHDTVNIHRKKFHQPDILHDCQYMSTARGSLPHSLLCTLFYHDILEPFAVRNTKVIDTER